MNHFALPLVVILTLFSPIAAEDQIAGSSDLRKKIDMALEAPVINTNPGVRYSDENRNKCNMVIGADRTPGGRIWAAWVSGGDSDKAYFVIATSDDDAETWSKPRMVIDPKNHPSGLRRRTLVGNFWTDPNGRLWLFFDQSMSFFDGRAGDWYIRCDNPDAKRPVWTRPKRIWHGCTLQKPTVLSTGQWLLPISLWQMRYVYQKQKLLPALDNQRKAWVFVSTDRGASWTKHGSVKFPHFSFDEHMIVELKDGRLWMTARTRNGIYETFSSDRGKTWSKPSPSAIVNTVARHFIRRLASGRILLVKNGPIDKNVNRYQLTAFLSDDEGKTWTGGLELEPRERRCTYPDGFQAPDGRIFIIYDHERTKAKEILMARFTEEDIQAGKLVAKGSKLRMLVNKAGKK